MHEFLPFFFVKTKIFAIFAPKKPIKQITMAETTHQLHRIKEVMKRLGVTQKELAERLEVSEPAFSTQLKSEGISLQRVYEIADALGVDIKELIISNKKSAGNTLCCPHCGKEISVSLS